MNEKIRNQKTTVNVRQKVKFYMATADIIG